MAKYVLLASDRQKIGDRLKAARIRAGMTHLQAAQATGILVESTLSHYEKGRALPSLPVFFRICKAYRVSMDKVLGGIEI